MCTFLKYFRLPMASKDKLLEVCAPLLKNKHCNHITLQHSGKKKALSPEQNAAFKALSNALGADEGPNVSLTVTSHVADHNSPGGGCPFSRTACPCLQIAL